MIYVDLGAYRGATIRRFIGSRLWRKGATVYAWECNPLLSGFNYGPGVIPVRAAAWVRGGTLPFYLSKTSPSRVQGSSVYRDKTTGNLDKDKPVEVSCIDFAAWLYDNTRATDQVIVKMNIEGAEYELLPHLIDTGAINRLDTLIVQWHWERIGLRREDHNSIAARLESVRSLTVYSKYEGVI